MGVLRAVAIAVATTLLAGSAAADVRTGTVTGTVTEGGSFTDLYTHIGSILSFNYTYNPDDAVYLKDYGFSIVQVGLTADIDGHVVPLADMYDGFPRVWVDYHTGSNSLPDRSQIISNEFVMAFNDAGVLGLAVESVPSGDDPPILIKSYVAGVSIGVTCDRPDPASAYACVASTPGNPLVFGNDFVINYMPHLYGNAYEGSWSGSMHFVSYTPEPGVWSLMMLGFGGAGMILRRRRRNWSIARDGQGGPGALVPSLSG